MTAMDDALNTFVAEGRELLDQMEEALLRIEQNPSDADTLNAIFRAAHTIKGSAGLFGIDHIVAFTHVAENLLDKLRGGALTANSDLVALLLAVRDHLGTLIDHVESRTEPHEETHKTSEELATRLRGWLGQSAQPDAAESAVAAAAPTAPAAASGSGDGPAVDSDAWHISLRFSKNVLQEGMDPLSFIRYLTTFGDIVHVVTRTDALPPFAEMEPEACYLGFEIAYRTQADKATIEGAFEFVRNDAHIAILPPHSRISEYCNLIESLPEDHQRLGEMLVQCGSLTQNELNAALKTQAAEGARPIGELLVDQKRVHPEVVEAALDKQKQVRERKVTEGNLIRVNAEKLDEHINLIGELIIASAGAGTIAQRANIPELFEAAARLARLVEEVRDSALTLRMVQIGATFNKFQRVVRDVSAELKKDIRLEISGAETELDKTVVEKIGDPLTHLIRNSMDHGIECEAVRVARGKPPYGTIRFNAYHDSGSIVIEVSDDGSGLDKERILKKALDLGLVKPDEQLSDSEIYNLIFEPGFSTAEKVNNLSGRGVGMDVVRRNISALRGTVEIESAEGVGATMRIRLPLTLAIIDGFLVGVANSSFVVPLEMVVECVELTEEETRAAHGRDHLNLRGEVLPFIRLKELFDIPEAALMEGDLDDYDASSAAQTARPGSVVLTAEGAAALAADPELSFILHPVKRENVVVVQYAGHRAGLVVEQLLGEFQTVIRPLGLVFNGLQGIAGFTILGNGHVALILDVPGLVRRVASGDRRRLAGSAAVVAEIA
jgi:two-component system chemotaxis sensor kinase CheA